MHRFFSSMASARGLLVACLLAFAPLGSSANSLGSSPRAPCGCGSGAQDFAVLEELCCDGTVVHADPNHSRCLPPLSATCQAFIRLQSSLSDLSMKFTTAYHILYVVVAGFNDRTWHVCCWAVDGLNNHCCPVSSVFSISDSTNSRCGAAGAVAPQLIHRELKNVILTTELFWIQGSHVVQRCSTQ